jgi:hypothetical protein
MPEQNSSISNFKQFLFRILFPLIILVSIAGIAFNYVFEKRIILNSQIGGAYKVNRIIKETHPEEIPIFGSSRADGGFIPDTLGANYFNYGLSGSKYDVTLFFLEEECKKKKHTPWIILNFDLDGLSYGLGNIANYIPNSNYAPIKELMGDKYSPYYAVPFIKYYGLYEKYTSDYVNNKVMLTKYADKGAAIERKVLTEKQFNELVEQRRNSPTTFKNDSILQQKLFNIIAAHPDRYFIFVVSPYHSSYFERYTNLPEATAFLNKLGAMKHVKVFDFSKMPLADSMFFNTSHTNYKGAAAFSLQLRDSLRSIGVD